MNRIATTAAAIIATLMGGCAANRGIETATISRKPEILFEAASLSDVKNRLVTYCTNSQMNVAEASEHTVTCEFEPGFGDALFVHLFVGNQYSTAPRGKYRFTLIQAGADVRVVARLWMETQMAFGQLRSVEMNDGQRYQQTQFMLHLWAGGAGFCKGHPDPRVHPMCDRVHPGWRSV